jgi:hypothetical protein
MAGRGSRHSTHPVLILHIGEKMSNRFYNVIPVFLYFGSRAIIAYIIAIEVMSICILMKPILAYSTTLGNSCSFLGLGIFFFLSIDGLKILEKA